MTFWKMNAKQLRGAGLKRSPWGEKRRASGEAEKLFQGRVEDLAAHTGWRTFHVYNPQFSSEAGFPDLVFMRERVFWAELKATSRLTGRVGKLSPKQEVFLDDLRAAGQEVYVWWDDSDDWEQIKRVLAKPGQVIRG